MSYTITAKDFQYLWNTSMAWKGLDWEEQADRFEGDQELNWEFKRIYWLGKEYTAVILTKMFFTSINQDYQILCDENTEEWVVITDYYRQV